ncbi:hypothetical protein CEXT_615231 [Caerostris extrusa]|uniref:Uncharacterized protein n=1 Tax=Caerostris extrusa TaxID=172846 RepID=A0AAV4PPE5_CAEEX|nr:hypothetical protein CEXT_615231 [Caerostris extrusa]
MSTGTAAVIGDVPIGLLNGPGNLKCPFTCKEFPPRIAVVQKGENSNIDKAEKWAQAAATELPAIHQPGQRKVPKKEIALRGHKSTGDPLLAQEMSSFWFRFGQRIMEDSLYVHGNCHCHWLVLIGLPKPI